MNLSRSAGFWLALTMVVAQPSAAQEEQAPAPSSSAVSPYGGLEHRPVKALSHQQMMELKAGRGMGLALSAELNGYPGPRHVIELADMLHLSDEQRAATQALFDAMKVEAIAIGERIIAEETALDRLFADKTIDPASLDAAIARISTAQGELRAGHLRSHLRMMEVLSPHQVARYATLRGYGGGDHNAGAH